MVPNYGMNKQESRLIDPVACQRAEWRCRKHFLGLNAEILQTNVSKYDCGVRIKGGATE